ncbi:uncharacterized protein Tco025E_00087 [Trypanosoma conorhini]|uniref:Uncharacterized protein n=1 Tax=Trypanosoma conorhini TaxID=83891 RepID=A0A3R7LI35_9TRYP|nr:uncharacterized protein Tco025E_00087 [Trypanosoma conorhini]RNF27703.1 hypothetical protein Tco025E_00087 [Trypanosoma conorhini]
MCLRRMSGRVGQGQSERNATQAPATPLTHSEQETLPIITTKASTCPPAHASTASIWRLRFFPFALPRTSREGARHTCRHVCGEGRTAHVCSKTTFKGARTGTATKTEMRTSVYVNTYIKAGKTPT